MGRKNGPQAKVEVFLDVCAMKNPGLLGISLKDTRWNVDIKKNWLSIQLDLIETIQKKDTGSLFWIFDHAWRMGEKK